jgi:glutathione S-transferase
MPDSMLTLFHHFSCPHSRFVRLILEELGTPPRLLEERTWERREEFLRLNPAGTTPVLVEEGVPPIPGAAIIAEYLDETRATTSPQPRMMPREPAQRIEIRRLMSWFNDKFFAEVSGVLVTERIYKRFIPANGGGGPPDTEIMRAARGNIKYHLSYIGWLVRKRDWLAGDSLSYADLAAAAHLSAVDYLGDVPWHEDETAKAWYARIKSRPSFRALLGEALPGVPPSTTYANLDF